MMEQMMDSQIDGALYIEEVYYEFLETLSFEELEKEINEHKQQNTHFSNRIIKMIKNMKKYKRGIVLKNMIK